MGLFDNTTEIEQDLGPGAVLLRGFALPQVTTLLTALPRVIEQAPFRHMVTPGGFRMSVAMTNCGSQGCISDRTGYRYDDIDPDSGRKWPSMTDSFLMWSRSSCAGKPL
jgi:alkylated DNA repair protein (DNA oxidative demethylase)